MTRTVQVRAEAPKPWLGPGACGFCTLVTANGVAHDKCPGTIVPQDPPGPRGTPGKKGVPWTCACHKAGHQGS